MYNQVLQSVSSSLSSLDLRNPLRENFNFSFRNANNRKTLKKSPFIRRTLTAECAKKAEETGANGGDLKDSLSGLVGKQVEELLSREENKGLLDGLEKASMRVELAKRELAEIQRQELEAKMLRDYVKRLEDKASEIAEFQQEIIEARAMVKEAERTLSISGDKDSVDEDTTEGYSIDKDRERLESVKAALVSAIIGILAELAVSISQVSSFDQLLLPLGITFISCALFGVTFRYTIRRDFDNVHLKLGASAAFGFIKGLGMLSRGPPLELSNESLVSHAVDGALFVSQSILIFAFASVGLDFCFKTGLLRPFPMRRSASDHRTTAWK